MKKLILFSAAIICLIFSEANAQFGYYNDALLFGRTTFGGSTRIQSLGGAQVSLGGDISSAGSNPAGLGFYNRSEFSFTPGLNFQNSSSVFNADSKNETFQNNFDIGNIGIVFNNQINKSGGLKSASFAITLNKINDFNDEISYSGYNDFSSILFSFQDQAGNLAPGAMGDLAFAAYDQYLLNPFEDNGELLFYDPVNFIGLDGNDNEVYSYPLQEETINRSGSQYQWNFSAGANYNDKLYFGASIGFVTMRYEQIRNYTESEFFIFNDNVSDDILDRVNLRDELDITGNGVNGTFGMIFRPIKYLTVGVSYVTPTFYTMTEESNFRLSSNYFQDFTVGDTFVEAGNYSFESDILTSNYDLRTPSKLNVGTTVFVGKHGFISGDVEFVDYGSSRLRSDDFSVNADNDEIASLYRSVVNYRVGGEYRLDMFRFRGGYSYMPNPYDSDLKRANESITFGVGLRQKKYFVDLGVVTTSSKEFYSPYTTLDNSQPEIETKFDDTKLMFTLGFNF